jgi:hypothetical protein
MTSMSNMPKRRLGIVVIAAAACVAAQVSGIASASAGNSAADGSAGADRSGVSTSQTPLLVRNGTAKLAHAMSANQHVRIAVGLKLRNTADLDKFNTALQDKKSPLFHKYLSAAEFNARYGPTAADESAVISWAKSHGIAVTKRYSNRLIVDLDGTASAISSALGVKLNNYTVNGKTFYSNDRDPALPSSLKSIVSSVDGLNNVAQLQSASGTTDTSKMAPYSAGPVQQLHSAVHADGSMAKLKAALAKRAAQPNAAPGNYDPTDIYSSQAYDEDALHKQSNCCNPFHVGTSSPAASSIAIATAGSHTISSDLAGWHTAFPYIAYSLNEYYIDGTPTSLDYEGTMDTEWSLSLANSFGSYQDTAHIYLYSGANAQFSTFDDIYNSILTNNTAKIVSSSWGCAEFFCTPDATMNTDHAIFVSMTAQGFTMVNSSGDRGAYADCNSAHRSVSHPASDPQWLAIGATNLELAAGPVYQSQTAWGDVGNCSGNGGGTGGGCSAKYAAPSWQSSISGFCGSTAKALPDVSLNGDWFNSPQSVYFNGSFSGNGGTSISAPMMAGFYAQQNSYGIELGNICGGGSAACAPLGQGGQQLYLAAAGAAQSKKSLYDITSGCTTNEVGSGFCAITGYDRATGWGTPNMLQFAWANNYWNMPEASPPTISMSGPSTSGWVNSGTISWSIVDQGSPASGVAGYTAKWDSDPGDQASEATPGTGASYYSGPASAHGATSGSTGLLVGCHTLFVRAWDNIGESAVNSYGPVCYDNTSPTVTAPTLSFLTNKVVRQANQAATVRVKWTGSDDLSGVSSFLLWQSTDGAAFVHLTPDNAVNQRDVVLRPGHTYSFAIGAFDNAGNFGGYSFSSTYTLSAYQENDASITYAPPAQWHAVSDSTALANGTEYTAATGRTATFTFHGSRVMWVAPKGTNRGAADVTLDGGAPTTVDTHATSAQPRRSVYAAGTGNANHTLVVKCNGTAGHARIDIDAFYVLST